jgi:tRNA pseudouridine38-40 synthase
MTRPFKMVALWCWYRGAAFHGYQRQQDPEGRELRTVQAELLRAFTAAGFTRNPVVAGRTDKLVDARMQVLSCRLERATEPSEMVGRLNALLPADLGIHLARNAPAGFHAAWSANEKEYRYALTLAEAGDLGRLREAAALVPGTRDYRAFHFKSSEVKPRTVHRVEVLEHASGVTLRFVGEGFARYMVRMLVGGLTAVSTGALPLDVLRAGLETHTFFHCPTAPAEGLTLWSVGYPEALDPFSDEERADFPWPPQNAGRA